MRTKLTITIFLLFCVSAYARSDVFKSKEACEANTGMKCNFQTCDYSYNEIE